jgi:hypothetical protein
MDSKEISIEKRLDDIFDKIDDLALEGKFEEIDNILDKVDVDGEPEYSILLGYLTITFAPAHELKRRCNLYDRILNRFQNDNMSDERIKSLIGGLKDNKRLYKFYEQLWGKKKG